jgi:O-antigen/teichoic acid export membrane protein
MLRTVGAVVVLSLGFHLVALGLNLLLAQIVGVILGYIFVKKAFPELKFGRKYIKVSALKEVVGYGSHSFAAHMASTTLEQSSALGIVKFLPIEFTGFYGLPTKLLQYTSDIISRGAVVTQTNAAELSAKGEKQALGKLGIYANRYSLLLFMPLSIFLLVFGVELIRVYAGPAFVTWSGPLMPLFVISTTFAIAGQYNSTNVLFGLAKHQRYAYGLIVEAVLFIGGMYLVLQQGYGIYGVAWVSAVLMVVNRGLYTGWLVCQAVEIGFFTYMSEIYLKAVLLALAVGGVAYWAKLNFIPGKGWPQLIAAGVSIGIVYSGLAFLICVEPHHRDTLLVWAKRKLPFLAKATA